MVAHTETATALSVGLNIAQQLTSPPQVPGISRGVSLTIAASVPTALGWYGYYKFSVEEELFQVSVSKHTTLYCLVYNSPVRKLC